MDVPVHTTFECWRHHNVLCCFCSYKLTNPILMLTFLREWILPLLQYYRCSKHSHQNKKCWLVKKKAFADFQFLETCFLSPNPLFKVLVFHPDRYRHVFCASKALGPESENRRSRWHPRFLKPCTSLLTWVIDEPYDHPPQDETSKILRPQNLPSCWKSWIPKMSPKTSRTNSSWKCFAGHPLRYFQHHRLPGGVK